MKRRTLVGLLVAGLFHEPLALGDVAAFVDPFIGTAGWGHTTPAACVPFGMVQAGPDTGNFDWNHCSGYVYGDKRIFGFSQTHLSGTGWMDLGDVLLLPAGDDVEWSNGVPYEKGSERAEPGWYAVRVGGVGVEIAASMHSAIYRFDYAGLEKKKLLIDCQWGLVGGNCLQERVKESTVSFDGNLGVRGALRVHQWVDRRYSFAVVFDHPFASCIELPRREGEKAPRYVFDFDLKPGEALMVKVGMSAGDHDDSGAVALRNLSAEIPNWDFDNVKGNAWRIWNETLGAATVEGTKEQKTQWYTSLYHLCVQPNNIADVGGRTNYSTFSCWDTFRAAGPLYTILYPDRAKEFVDSMLGQGRKIGYLPIWSLWGQDNQCMIGTHAVPMIVDWFLKEGKTGEGERRKYWECAYAQIKDTLTKSHEGRLKERWDLYDKYGYYPFDLIRGESVSRTVECAYDDWCAGLMAEELGHKDDAMFFFRRASYWKNVFDSSIGFVRGRDGNGKWREPFDPFSLGHGAELDNDFTEGNAFQYTWHAMQAPQGLIAAMGGREKFIAKLDSLFGQVSKTEGQGLVHDITGLIGQYVHGNEPSHHVIYFYPLVGCPEKAAERIREVADKFYLPKPDGLCGNDDCGQMSAWYLFSAMGFYPFNPCGGEYVIGAPQVPMVQVRVGSEKQTFKVLAKGVSRENKYVKSVMLNGRRITDWKIRHADIVRGGELVFEMTDAPQ